MGADDHLVCRRERVQGDLDFRDEGESAFGAGEELAEGESGVLVDGLDCLVDSVSAAAALEAFIRVVFFDEGACGGVIGPGLQLREDGVQ